MKRRQFFLVFMTFVLTAAVLFGGITPGWTAPVTGPGTTPDYYETPNWAYSPPLRKFVDTLPGLTSAGINNLGQYIPIANPDTTTYPGSDYYEIGLSEYTKVMHSDMPGGTRLRGYYQINNGTVGVTDHTNQYLGPLIIAQKDRPVRVKFVNNLSTGAAGNLFVPVDTTIMGSGDYLIDYDPETKLQIPLTPGTFTQNRATLHLHGGHSPWISDGTSHQWITPAGEATSYPKGVSVSNVPDMWFDSTNGATITACAGLTACGEPNATNNPGAGAQTFFWSNQQSSRLMFYHDHAWGITRLNVYAGEAAGFLLQDPIEQTLVNGGTVNGVTFPGVIPVDQIPLIIQDKTFVDPVTITTTDPTWAWGSQPWAGGAMTPVQGDLWWPHVYMPAQNPYNPDLSGINAMGRWHYGPWFWPSTPLCFAAGGTDPEAVKPYCIDVGPAVNPYYDPACIPDPTFVLNNNFCQPPEIPGTPNPSWGAEAFLDTPMINGTVYPTTTVQPKAYRLRVLNASHDRFFNLQLYKASPIISGIVVNSGGSGYTSAPAVTITPAAGDITGRGATAAATIDPLTGAVITVDMLTVGSGYTAVPTVTIAPPTTVGGTTAAATATLYSLPTEVGMVPAAVTAGFPANWPIDGREGGVPDPATSGPELIQIGTEGGFLPQPVVLPNQPVAWNLDPTMFNVGNVLQQAEGGGTLFLGPAERADVIIDFSAYAGQTLILYNDAPTAFPALDPHYDYYTANPDRTDMGGTIPTPAGYGPNVRTLMQIYVAPAPVAAPFNLSALQSAFAPTPPAAGVFEQGQEPIIVGQAAYNSTYNMTFPATWPNWGLSRISDTSISFLKPDGTTVSNFPMKAKAIHDEMGGTFDDFGRMSAKLGLEVPFANAAIANFVLQNYVDPASEIVSNNEVQIWKITHNGVDTHPIHFHLFEVQVINRVGWDGFIRLPDPNELGWKDTVRIAPLEDTIVALRVKAPTVPFALPDSIRPLNPSRPAFTGDMMGFSQIDQQTGADIVPPTTNVITNFGWEYVWHCHILSHEENDMMRPIILLSGAAGAPIAGVTPTALTFADQLVNTTSAPQTITLSNTGTDPLTINSIIIGGLNASNFARTTTCGASLAAASNCTIDVTFTPTVIGARAGSVIISTSDILNPTLTVTMTGTGIAPIAGVAPVSLTFADQLVNTTSAAQTVTLSNTGTAPMTINSVTLTGTNAGDFALTNLCVSPLAAASSCTIDVTFTPIAAGARTASVSISSNDLVNPTLAVTLTGTGIAPIAGVAPVSLTFADQLVNTTSAPQTITLSNTGTAPLTINSILIGGTNPGDFGSTTTCGASLAAASSCTIDVTFTPAAMGARAASVSISSNDLVNPTLSVTLTGTGITPIAGIAPTSLAFGTQLLNTTNSELASSPGQLVILSNTGNIALTINSISIAGANAGDFSQLNACGASLSAGANCSIFVTFRPTAVGARVALLTISSNDPVNPTLNVSLSGMGTAIQLIPTALSFRNQLLGTTSTNQIITMTNSGTTTLAISGITITGANAGDFLSNNNCGTSLGAGRSCYINVRFRPAASGLRVAAISISDSDPTSPQTVSLRGTGVAPVLSLSPASLSFGAVTRNTTSAPQTVTVSNTGTASLKINSISIGGRNPFQFARTTNCPIGGTGLAVGGSCTINVTFSPTSTGAKSALLNVNVAAPAASQSVSLSGTGI